MKLPPIAIQEFKEMYKKEYGEVLDDRVANESLINLINLLRAIYKPIPNVERRKNGTRMDKNTE